MSSCVLYLVYARTFHYCSVSRKETIRINVKNKSATRSGMLSAAGLSGGGTVKPKASMLLESPPSAAGKH
jgi:hypothetical protein